MEKSNKFVIMVPPEAKEPSEIIRIDTEAAQILNELYLTTGLSVRFLASDMIRYAYQNLQIKKRGK